MKCLVCGSTLLSYFTKDFGGEYSLNKIHYDRCTNCGLVIARELLEMPLKQWEQINYDFHMSFLWKKDFNLDPNWNTRILKQVQDIKELHSARKINANYSLDYACGDGRLVGMLNRRIPFPSCYGYDKYVGFTGNCDLLTNQYDLVINTSFFEHIRHRDNLDEVNKLVADGGALALHTLVCDKVPRDPDWFYLVPVHSVVYTNKAMQILFDQWEYSCSLYNPDSRMWFWFKEDISRKNIPGRFLYKKEFIDYWK
jgi:hypothetical protein